MHFPLLDNDVEWREVALAQWRRDQSVALWVADINDLRRDQAREPFRGRRWYRIQRAIDRLVRALYEVDREASREQRHIEYMRV